MIETLTLYLAAARDGNPFDPKATFAFVVFDAAGLEVHRGSAAAGPTQSPYYAALLAALPSIPDRAHLAVITEEEHLHGRTGPAAYLGVLNEAPSDRVARGYLKGRDGKGVYKNEDQLRELDRACLERGITMDARRPQELEDAERFYVATSAAKGLLHAGKAEVRGGA